MDEGHDVGSLYELRAGTVEVVRSGIVVAVVSEPGTLFGELALLLGRPASATVRATSNVTVVTVDDAPRRLTTDPGFVADIARLLARRLDAMTGYLVDLRTQYADHEGGLGMIDEVLASLTHAASVEVEAGSEREPEAPY